MLYLSYVSEQSKFWEQTIKMKFDEIKSQREISILFLYKLLTKVKDKM